MQTKKTTPVREALGAKARLAIEPQAEIALDQRAIDDGLKPLASRRQDLAALRAKIAELYAISAGGLAAIAAIENAFRFSPLESDGEFNYLDIEGLLDQAAGLLEQCAATRSQRDALQMEKWKLQIELDRFLRLDHIEERERAAGADTLPYQRAALETSAESSLEANYKNAETQLKGLTDDLVSHGFNQRMAARELTAWLSAYPLKDNELRGDDASYSFDGALKTKPEHLFDAARREVDEAAWEQIFDLMARRLEDMAASEAGRFRKESQALQMKWALADIAFRGERAQVERDAFWEKVNQATASGGLFNYSERIALLERQFALDFREALARLIAARPGFKELYDYAPPFPQEGTQGFFDDVELWVRTARNKLELASRQDQTYVLAVSVKDLAKGQWEPGRAAGQWTFDLPAQLFEGQAQVRLRGLGLAVIGPPEQPDSAAAAAPHKGKGGQKADLPSPSGVQGVWSARIVAPASARVTHLSGTAIELDQKSLPPIFLGRVASQDSAREPEIAGLGASHNASPIGQQWKLTLSPKSTAGTPTATLDDVQLYLQVAVRGLKAGA